MVLRKVVYVVPNTDFKIAERDDGVIYCTCLGWKFSRSRPRECVHMKKWAEMLLRQMEKMSK